MLALYRNLFSKKIIGNIFVIIVGIAFGLLHLQFSAPADNEKYTINIAKIISAKSDRVLTEITRLVKTAKAFQQGETSHKHLKKQLQKTRNAYKEIAFILTYYYPEHNKAYLNGAPLFHLDPFPIDPKYDKQRSYYNVPPKDYKKSLPLDYLNTDHYRGNPQVIPPEGLQALDELIFTNPADKEKITALCSKLKTHYTTLNKAIKERKFFYDFEILEASRLGLVSIYTLGITGFDTPGSLNALEEAKYSLQGIETIMTALWKTKTAIPPKQFQQLIDAAKKFIDKSPGFEHFDRLVFLTDYVNPLYAKMLYFQKKQNIPSSAKRHAKIPSWNAESNNLFAENFLNPYYYSQLSINNDSKRLQKLGKRLFYDKTLSAGKNISCASCHKPELAFTDGLKKALPDPNGKKLTRNTPSLINAVYADRYFYDLRAFDLEEQAAHVIRNHLEYNTSFSEVVKKLKKDTGYVTESKTIFGDKQEINRYWFSSALSSYVLSLRSFNSKFDQYIRGEISQIDPKIKKGFNLFMGKANCATCHFPPTFSGLVPPLYQENETEVLGVLKTPTSKEVDFDAGRFDNKVLQENQEIYRKAFKTTTVRNVELTAPYFHNGAYKTLEEVVNFYNQGGAAGMGLQDQVPYQTLSADSLKLTQDEIESLIGFMNALSDNPFAEK